MRSLGSLPSRYMHYAAIKVLIHDVVNHVATFPSNGNLVKILAANIRGPVYTIATYYICLWAKFVTSPVNRGKVYFYYFSR